MQRYLILFLVLAIVCETWAAPKPLESIENYNVLMIHGAYGSKKGIKANAELKEAYSTSDFLGNATLGSYTSNDRITKWIGTNVFEEPDIGDKRNPSNAYIYNWRSFTNPANTSLNNAYEMADRMWNAKTNGSSKFGKRRALFEEAQEVKAVFHNSSTNRNDSGQVALDSIRKHSDLYRQLASRYILIGHSMGGVTSREYVQSNFYNDDVDKIITLDSPHEGTGALNMQISKEAKNHALNVYQASMVSGALALTLAKIGKESASWKAGLIMLAMSFGLSELTPRITKNSAPEDYYESDPLVGYVDPRRKGPWTISFLNERPYDADRLPMFRILASRNGMTFSDPNPKEDDFGMTLYRAIVPDVLTKPFENIVAQIWGGTESEAYYVNASFSFVAGMLGMPIRERGSSIVPDFSSEGRNVDVLNDAKIDVRRNYFNAAPNASSSDAGYVALGSLYADAMLGLWIASRFGVFGEVATSAAVVGITVCSAISLASKFTISIQDGIADLTDSHTMPLQTWFLDTMKVSKNSFTPIGNGASSHTPYLMEDFLYEKPFVNLALNDSRTMGMLAQDSSLNPNCYFESDSLQKVPLCEVGLYGSRDSVVIDPVTMKETHIYNAAVAKTDSAGNVVLDSLGNVVYDSVYYGTFEQRKYSEFRKSPLKFKAESDWYKVGVKVDRWERVPGLKPNGNVDSTYVPIRHVERYSVPDIVATGFIEKYSFVVDDLMPHRMRQIKMTFNSNEEVAWECDISKAEDDQHACAVYKRKLGNSWGNPDTTIGDKGYVAHPIKKNGRFDFEARKYFGNLANIQKDNQNTVMISMVNKIGLSNTQRFYYLFKATDNMLKPKWPEHDVVLNAIDGFKAYVSALDYQGFRVHNASDAFFRDSLGNDVQTYSTQVMDTAIVIGNNNSEYVFVSNQNDPKPAEGSYRWVVSTNISNKELKAPSEPDSCKTDSYEVHFKVDRTAPAFTLTSDAMMNPDSSMFITRFKWDGSGLSDIRAMRWTLEKSLDGSQKTFTKVAELPALYDVASNEFAIAWDKVPQSKRDSMGNGLYRIAAYAIDYAVPNLDAYHKVNALVDSIFANPTNLSDNLWNRIDSLGLNDITIYAEFRVDTAAPVFTFRETRAVSAADTMNYGTYVNLSGKYDALRANRPARNADWTYISKDSLLQIGYTVLDSLNGLDSAAVTIGWNFVHLPDTNVIDRAGDSVWVFDSLNGRASGSWTEMAGLRMADGEYSVRAILRDEAKNVRQDVVPKRIRVDRTAPQIVGLTSDHLVYMDKDGDFSATILVSEKADIGVNRTGMHCSYRILGGADSSWHEIRKGDSKLLANDTVKFSIAKTSIGNDSGIRYLEAACVDAAGNVSVRTDLFHVGARFPRITYPLPDIVQSNQSYIPIVGVAPKTSSADSLSSVYRLRYRVGNDTTWKTDKVKVIAANRSASADNISRISQGTEGVLGYFENDSLNDERLITVELAIASCETCNDWSAVMTNMVVVSPNANYNKPTVEFSVTRNGSNVNTFKVDDGPVDISVRLKNKFNSNYMLRVYAEDSKHRGIFDASVEKVFYNPYYGDSVDTAKDTAIWFYEKDGKYYLKWKNLDKINLKVGYNSAKFSETCVDSAGKKATGCSTEYAPINFNAVLDVAKAYLADYPEWMPPAYIDSAMTISDATGEIVMEAEDAFRVYVERKNLQDTSALNVPVYFGKSDNAGFYWITGADATVSPLMTGWTVNPNAYGLNYRWNGIATSGAYPSGDITLYAEVTENVLDNPFITVVEKKIKVEQKNVELVAPKSLPDYITLRVVDPNAVVVDDSNKVAYMRDSMKVYFGLKNGEAHVKISVLDSSKSPVRTLLDSALSAHTGDSAYSVIWDGKDSLGNVQSVGTYYIRFESPSNSFAAKNVSFKMKLRNGILDQTPDDPKAPKQFGFYVAEAKKVADDIYRYEPYADYLVDVQMKGWYLPNSRRYDRFDVTGNVSGTQNILGFRPERFSLGIKRHRDTLEMYIVSKLHNMTVKLENCGGGCDKYNKIELNNYKLDSVLFDDSHRSKLLVFNEGNDSRGFLDFEEYSYLDVVACSKKMWKNLGGLGKNSKSITDEFFDSLKSACEWNIDKLVGSNHYKIPDPGRCVEFRNIESYPYGLFEDAEKACKRPGLYSNFSFRGVLPAIDDSCLAEYFCPQMEYKTISLTSDDKNIGCDVDSLSGYLDSVCVTDNNKYDPNLRLFNIVFAPSSTKRFFSNWTYVNSNHSIERYWTKEYFSMTLEIPDSYWNAPFGMDNLVNRTIRFDHTNETIFNKNDKDGYWNAVKEKMGDSITGYFDGNKWGLNPKYGMLTPYEVQHLIFFPVDILPNSNAFNFDDESEYFRYTSSFELKFYGDDSPTHHFVAKVIGDLVNPQDTSGCVVDTTKLVMKIKADNPCQVSVTSENQELKKTPVFAHGNVHFFVGMNRLWSEADNGHRTSIPYPVDSASWNSAIGDLCKDTLGWESYKRIAEGKDSCYKYYGSGSRVHYYFNDYSDSLWKIHFLTDSLHYFRNYVNSPGRFLTPESMDSLFAVVKKDLNGKDFVLSYFLNPDSFVPERTDSEPGRFFIHMGYLDGIKRAYSGAGVSISDIKIDMGKFDSSRVSFDSDAMNLYIKAEPWTEHVLYRRTIDTSRAVLERPNTRTLPLRDIYTFRVDPLSNNCDKSLYCKIDTVLELLPNPWIKNAVVDKATLLQIDSTEHPILEISTSHDSSDRIISFKDTVVARPAELVEIRGRLDTGVTYSLSFLNGSTYYTISDSIKVDSSCSKNSEDACHLAWFNVNKLQGRTQFLMTWGDKNGNPTNAMHFNMYVGSNVNSASGGVVKSLYGDLSVTFPVGSIDKAEDFTVRTVNVQKDYGFGVFKDMALTGPVMEVLPSMTFKDTNNLPRIQMKISKKEMDDMNVGPQTLRLYKVDFDNKRFVPLEDVLYGFLYADGSAVSNAGGNGPLKCDGKTDVDTRCSGNFGWEYVLVSAQTRTFSVFVAMDSLAAFVSDSTQEELPVQFACSVPSDSLWMGTDNGYLAYGATCNHPGTGTLSLYRDNSLVVEVNAKIPDTLRYDGKRRIGGAVVGAVDYGRYESRYLGKSILGENVQLAGPVVRTDSARPVISSFGVLLGEDVIDRIFTVRANVRDIESGLASVVVSSTLGNADRTPLVLQPDSLGNVTAELRITRRELTRCSGCKLSLEIRAEDYGHNHAEMNYDSEVLYPYPTELTLWYPSHEGFGNLAHEYVGEMHHLNLESVASPWQGDAGVYFSKLTDYATGIGRVNFGTSTSYSFEARIRNGNITNPGWLRILGFKGVGGLEMELRVHNRKLQVSEGSRLWSTKNDVLPVAKEWSHVVVTVDSSEVRLYVNGEMMMAVSAEPLERELDGVFSVGADNGNSFIGNIADVRMYKKALSGAEVLALSQPVSEDGEIVEIVTVPMVTVDGGDGFEPEFSCSVAGNRYFESSRDGARLTMDAHVEKSGRYKVMMYVRSASLNSANVAIMPSPGMRYVGTLALSPVWRTAIVSDVSMNLSAGVHTVTLEAPEGLQVAGFALVTANVTASSIAWNAGFENPQRKVKTYVRYEGFNDKKVLQPRVRLKNISGSAINGYSVRYYFRGEESSMAKVHAYYPRDTVGLSLHSESARTGFAEWKFENGIIPAYGMVFNGDGPHFGVHYEDWTPWNPYDDPSFVENAATDFVEDDGIIVLDADKRLIGGSCVEMEDSVSVEVRARVFAQESRNDNSATELQMKVENVGNVTLKNYDVRYYFFLEGGVAPLFDLYGLPEGVSASLENIGEGRWQVSLHASKSLVPGGSWENSAQFALHCENWIDIWNSSDDPSGIGLGYNMVEAVGVNVFDSLGNRIYGNEPVWPEIVHVATSDSSDVLDYGLKPKDGAIPIHRTGDGLLIELPQYTRISLSLVNVVGIPVKDIYSGTVAPGEQFIAVDWSGIDLNRTYLMLRVNDAIKSTKLLSLL